MARMILSKEQLRDIQETCGFPKRNSLDATDNNGKTLLERFFDKEVAALGSWRSSGLSKEKIFATLDAFLAGIPFSLSIGEDNYRTNNIDRIWTFLDAGLKTIPTSDQDFERFSEKVLAFLSEYADRYGDYHKNIFPIHMARLFCFIGGDKAILTMKEIFAKNPEMAQRFIEGCSARSYEEGFPIASAKTVKWLVSLGLLENPEYTDEIKKQVLSGETLLHQAIPVLSGHKGVLDFPDIQFQERLDEMDRDNEKLESSAVKYLYDAGIITLDDVSMGVLRLFDIGEKRPSYMSDVLLQLCGAKKIMEKFNINPSDITDEQGRGLSFYLAARNLPALYLLANGEEFVEKIGETGLYESKRDLGSIRAALHFYDYFKASITPYALDSRGDTPIFHTLRIKNYRGNICETFSFIHNLDPQQFAHINHRGDTLYHALDDGGNFLFLTNGTSLYQNYSDLFDTVKDALRILSRDPTAGSLKINGEGFFAHYTTRLIESLGDTDTNKHEASRHICRVISNAIEMMVELNDDEENPEQSQSRAEQIRRMLMDNITNKSIFHDIARVFPEQLTQEAHRSSMRLASDLTNLWLDQIGDEPLKNGRTVLHILAESSRIVPEEFRAMLSASAFATMRRSMPDAWAQYVNAEDQQGISAVSIAARKGNAEILESLFRHGARPFPTCDVAASPLELAVISNSEQSEDALRAIIEALTLYAVDQAMEPSEIPNFIRGHIEKERIPGMNALLAARYFQNATAEELFQNGKWDQWMRDKAFEEGVSIPAMPALELAEPKYVPQIDVPQDVVYEPVQETMPIIVKEKSHHRRDKNHAGQAFLFQ